MIVDANKFLTLIIHFIPIWALMKLESHLFFCHTTIYSWIFQLATFIKLGYCKHNKNLLFDLCPWKNKALSFYWLTCCKYQYNKMPWNYIVTFIRKYIVPIKWTFDALRVICVVLKTDHAFQWLRIIPWRHFIYSIVAKSNYFWVSES